MKCIIVDDEPLSREGIELNLQDVNYLTLVGEFANAMSANDFLAQNQVDLIFLDIQMPGLTGIDFIRTLKDPPLVILTTAYPDYALEGFELDVVDYLMKPIRLDRFIKATNKAKELHDLYDAASDSETKVEDDFIYIKSNRNYQRLFFKDINYIKGLKDYVVIYTDEGKVMTAMNIKTINNQLPDRIFARVSKSYIVNINHIKSVEPDMIHLGTEQIPLGRTYKNEFIEKYIKTNLIQR